MNTRSAYKLYAEQDTDNSAGILAFVDHDVLLLYRDDGAHKGTWASPGGHIKEGESEIEAAMREFREETGYAGDFFNLELFTRMDNEKTYTLFTANVDDKFTPVLNNEHSNFGWFDLEKLPRPVHPGLQSVLTT